jgi:hypothetical protein
VLKEQNLLLLDLNKDTGEHHKGGEAAATIKTKKEIDLPVKVRNEPT